MEELTSLAREKETESLMLKWAGENDTKAYLKQLEDERRLSLQFRNQEGRRHRELDEEAHQKKVQESHVEEALQAGCKFALSAPIHFVISFSNLAIKLFYVLYLGREDVEEYKRECAARDRASLVFRGKEIVIQRIEDEKMKR